MMADIHHINAHRVVHLPVKAPDQLAAARPREGVPTPPPPPARIASEIEARYRDDRPDLYAALAEQEAPTWRDELRADWREFCAELVASPYSHAFVALLGFIAGLLLVIVPAMIGAGMLS